MPQEYIPAGTHNEDAYAATQNSRYGISTQGNNLDWNQLANTFVSEIDSIIYAWKGQRPPADITTGGGYYGDRGRDNSGKVLMYGAGLIAIALLIYFAFIKK